MKCPKTRPPLRSVSGKEMRPEGPCPDELQILEPGLGSCPYHGLVEFEVIDDLTGKQQEIMDRIVAEAKANGKKKAKKKGRKNRG